MATKESVKQLFEDALTELRSLLHQVVDGVPEAEQVVQSVAAAAEEAVPVIEAAAPTVDAALASAEEAVAPAEEPPPNPPAMLTHQVVA